MRMLLSGEVVLVKMKKKDRKHRERERESSRNDQINCYTELTKHTKLDVL